EAFAGVGLGVVPTFPSPVTVGQAGLAASVTISNLSNGAEATGNVTLSDITLVPSCGTFTPNSDCPVAGADPGVFQLSAVGHGRSGTGCAGVTFTITTSNPATGQVTFNSPPVVLGPPSSGALATCIIDFTFDVVKSPTKDVSPASGLQTEQIGAALGFHDDGTPGSGTGTSFVTVKSAIVPTCTLTAVIAGPPKQIQITAQDTGSGLASVVVTTSANATTSVPAFTVGTTSPVVITSTKTNQAAGSTVALKVTDRSGNVTTCDPVDVSISRTTGQPHTETVTGLSAAEHLVMVANATPGLSHLHIVVNRNEVMNVSLEDGQTTNVDIAALLASGSNNTVTVTGAGHSGASATVVFHD
ncbi:MAG: hypothetical protein QOK39_1613, partial [Acidimicrobiaceae bacterium]|nr:hypothetical protein [Acidimicrobiaceae bacterium]